MFEATAGILVNPFSRNTQLLTSFASLKSSWVLHCRYSVHPLVYLMAVKTGLEVCPKHPQPHSIARSIILKLAASGH